MRFFCSYAKLEVNLSKVDPIVVIQKKVKDDPNRIKQIEEEVTNVLEDAVKFALESPYPAPDEALEDIYA